MKELFDVADDEFYFSAAEVKEFRYLLVVVTCEYHLEYRLVVLNALDDSPGVQRLDLPCFGECRCCIATVLHGRSCLQDRLGHEIFDFPLLRLEAAGALHAYLRH